MPLRVLIVPDKFKGTLTAEQAARAIARGWRRARPNDRLELLPMSDGGDGFGPILGRLLRARPRRTRTVNAAHRPVSAPWWLDVPHRTAIIETARVIGLAMLPPGRFHPFRLDTFGLGNLLRAAARAGAKACLIGIGGSATNDGGFGLARALGWQFLDASGATIQRWTDLHQLRRLVPPSPPPLGAMSLTVAVDVGNPLLGPQGATRIYGPQKGIRPSDIATAEAALGQLARIVRRHLGTDLSRTPGAGAAGGLGFGLFAFAGARPRPGIDLFREAASLDQRLARHDLVITGEGSLDLSTLMGKGVGEVAALCRQHLLPCIGLSGVLADRPALLRRFRAIQSICPDLAEPADARAHATRWLAAAAAAAAHHWSGSP